MQGNVRLLEVRLVELELESSHARVDLDLPAPGDLREIAGRRAGRARHQTVLPWLESESEVAVREEDGQRLRPGSIRILVQIDGDRPWRAVDERAQRDRLTAGRRRD